MCVKATTGTVGSKAAARAGTEEETGATKTRRAGEASTGATAAAAEE